MKNTTQNSTDPNLKSTVLAESASFRPVKISQNWKQTSYDFIKRKWNQHPIVSAKQSHLDKMKPISRDVWFDYIRKGWLMANTDVRKWLDENGFADVKPSL